MSFIQTERLNIRELDSAADAEFIFALLNTPKFLKYIGDRGVRNVEQASEFIENRYRQSYRDHGFGLYVVEQKDDKTPVGLCGFVRRETLTAPDLGFAFLSEFERKGYGFESAKTVLDHGREKLGFRHVQAITSLNNHVSGRLLEKLGFVFAEIIPMPDGDVKLYNAHLFD
jgi:RimJ/RimL family protein N-acetyltransferase